jgi:hypothetical protein
MTYKFLNEMGESLIRHTVSSIESILHNMPTGEIDKIPTIKYPDEEKEFINKTSTVIDVLYPNEKGFVSIYWMGAGLFKLA